MRMIRAARRVVSPASGAISRRRKPRTRWASWYRLAPVVVSTSIIPASIMGTMHERCRPAGVIAPDIVQNTLFPPTTALRISRCASRTWRPTKAGKAVARSSAGVSLPVIPRGRTSGEASNWARTASARTVSGVSFVSDMKGSGGEGRGLSRSGRRQGVLNPGRCHRRHRHRPTRFLRPPPPVSWPRPSPSPRRGRDGPSGAFPSPRASGD